MNTKLNFLKIVQDTYNVLTVVDRYKEPRRMSEGVRKFIRWGCSFGLWWFSMLGLIVLYTECPALGDFPRHPIFMDAIDSIFLLKPLGLLLKVIYYVGFFVFLIFVLKVSAMFIWPGMIIYHFSKKEVDESYQYRLRKWEERNNEKD